jgi:23S rRNA (uracil1939-C5)-methyltransferase/tRNA (uracil-5-)-methyltransferase
LRETNEGVITDPREEVSDTVNGLTFKYTAGSFFQNNPFVLPHMVQYVVDKAKAAPGLRFLVDAYCGGGLFCLSASKHFEVSGFVGGLGDHIDS